MIRKWIRDIRDKTEGMSGRDKTDYVLTYYWYHFLIVGMILFVIVLFGNHYLFGNKNPGFFCAVVNQAMSDAEADALASGFAQYADLETELTVIDPNYRFSYGGIIVNGANESYYEKFFLQWRQGELDAVVIPEQFYLFCKEMGGVFRTIQPESCGTMEPYWDEGQCRAVILGQDSLMEVLTGEQEEILLLAFPETGMREETSDAFLSYLKDGGVWKGGTAAYEEVFD